MHTSPDSSLNPSHRSRLRRRLLAWFDRAQRPLPWRRDRNPYRIWVSEVMLQQTQAATVVRFYEPFLEKFPTLHALAAASEQEVLRAWEGLGYYRRARDLHRAARFLLAKHQSVLPDDPDVLAGLPGVGRYMMGAILSQAYDRRLPIIEANSERVLCRLFGQRLEPRSSECRRWLWEVAERLLPRRRVGDFNQALMELGALICTPVAPRCPACPLQAECIARREGLQDVIPTRAARPSVVQVSEVAIVMRRSDKVFLVQRPETGRWAGMWEFPHGVIPPGETHEQAAHRLLHELTGCRARLGRELLTIRHTVAHHRITMVCLEGWYLSGRFHSSFYQAGRWLNPRQLAAYPVSMPQRRIARALLEARQQHLF